MDLDELELFSVSYKPRSSPHHPSTDTEDTGALQLPVVIRL